MHSSTPACFCQTSDLGLRLEVDFVFPLSQQEEQEEEEQEQEPHQNLSDRIELKVWNLEHRGQKKNRKVLRIKFLVLFPIFQLLSKFVKVSVY